MYTYYSEDKTSKTKTLSSFSWLNFDDFNSTSFKIFQLLPNGSLKIIIKNSLFIKKPLEKVLQASS